MWDKDPPCFPLICRFSAVFPGCPLFFLKSFLLGTRQICKMWPSIITDTWIMTSWHLNTSGWRWCNKDFIGKPCTLYLCLRSPWPGYQVWGGCQSEEWLPPCSCAAHSGAERMWRMHRTGREINTETMKQQSHRMPRLNFFLSGIWTAALFIPSAPLVPVRSCAAAALSSRWARCLGWPAQSRRRAEASPPAPRPRCSARGCKPAFSVRFHPIETGRRQQELPVYCSSSPPSSFCQIFCGHQMWQHPPCTGIQSTCHRSHITFFCCRGGNKWWNITAE